MIDRGFQSRVVAAGRVPSAAQWQYYQFDDEDCPAMLMQLIGRLGSMIVAILDSTELILCGPLAPNVSVRA
jgi:hypothetical protein